MQATGMPKGGRVLRGGEIPNIIYGALVRMLGLGNAEAIEFYVDTRLAVDDPERYESSLRLLLGEQVGSLVVTGIKTELARKSGAAGWGESLLGQVRTSERTLHLTLA